MLPGPPLASQGGRIGRGRSNLVPVKASGTLSHYASFAAPAPLLSPYTAKDARGSESLRAQPHDLPFPKIIGAPELNAHAPTALPTDALAQSAVWIRAAAGSCLRGRPPPAALHLGHLMMIEDRGTEARLVAEVARGHIDSNPTRRGQSLGSDSGHLPGRYALPRAMLSSGHYKIRLCMYKRRKRLTYARQSGRKLRSASIRPRSTARFTPARAYAVRLGQGRAAIRIPRDELER